MQYKYSTYNRQLLEIYMAITHFRPYVEEKELIVYTDHKTLCHSFTTNRKIPRRNNPRLLRQLAYIAFTTDYRHIGGELKPVVDSLSRIEQIDCPSLIDWKDIADM